MPNLPTDNLYKFQALVGLASMFLIIWFFTEQYDRTRIEIIKLENESSVLTQKMYYEKLADEVNQVEVEATKYVLNLHGQIVGLNTDTNELNKIMLQKQSEEDVTKFKQFLKDQLESDAKANEQIVKNYCEQEMRMLNEHRESVLTHTEFVGKCKLDEYEASKLVFLFKSSVIGFCISLMLTLLGFWNWSRKVQVYQDRILKNEAEKYLSKK